VTTAPAIPRKRRSPSSPPTALVECACADLQADFRELEFLCADAARKLADFEGVLDSACAHARTRDLLARRIAASRRRYCATAGRVRSLRCQAGADPRSRSLIDELAAQKESFAELLRAEQALLAALLSAADWQSPSYLHSLTPAAGRHAGQIRAHWNDYKRDRHPDGDAYERRYVESMIDGPSGLQALLTSCGMAAFATILWFLLGEGKLSGPVIAGAGLYHESRLLLDQLLPGRVRYVDERDTTGVLAAFAELEPSAVFLDSLSNSAWMPMPELAALIDSLRGSDTYLILDNTGLSLGCQPFLLAGEGVRLVMFESLLKYAQLGLDRANAGVIVTGPDDAAVLDRYREHMGTNLADVSVQALPRPDRGVLGRRLLRLERNALLIAKRLSERAPARVTIVHPGLSSHACAQVAASLPFRGGCLSVVFDPRGGCPGCEQALVEAAVRAAAQRGVPLLAGSSFAFDTTRVYPLTDAAYGGPFVRIAAGTEHRLAVESIAEVLADALETVVR
jgi:cystathionine beta-lyase/cystathionine gamma-synthase